MVKYIVLHSPFHATVGMELAAIWLPENSSHGKIALPEPDEGKPHPYYGLQQRRLSVQLACFSIRQNVV